MTSRKNDPDTRSPLPQDRPSEPLARTDHPADDWDGDPRFAPFPILPIVADATAWGGADGEPDEWDGDPRFADYPIPPVVHGLDGIDDGYVVALRPDLRIVDEETFKAVRAMRPAGRREGTR